MRWERGVRLAIAAVLFFAASCGSAVNEQEATLTVGAIAEPGESEDHTVTTWIGVGDVDGSELPPVTVTAVSGELARTENNTLAWVRALLGSHASPAELAELDVLIALGPALTFESPEGFYFTRPDLLELGVGREPTLAPDAVGFVPRYEVEQSDNEVLQALDRLNTAFGGVSATDPLAFLSEVGAETRAVSSAGPDGLRSLEACAPAIDLMEWFVRTVAPPDEDVDSFVAQMSGRVQGDLCWTLEVDDQTRIRHSLTVMDFEKMFVPGGLAESPPVLTEAIEWEYGPVQISIPDPPYVDVTDLFLSLLEQ